MTITIEPIKANVNGVSYFAEPGTVTEAWLGVEDHGIFTYELHLNFARGGQGAGNYNLNDPEQMGKHLQALMKFFGCPFNYIKSKKVYALYDHQGGAIVGLLSEDQDKVLIFREVSNG